MIEPFLLAWALASAPPALEPIAEGWLTRLEQLPTTSDRARALARLRTEALDLKAFTDRVLIGVSDLSAADRQRLRQALAKHLERRGLAGLGKRKLSCLRLQGQWRSEGAGRVWTLPCTLGEESALIELYLGADQRLYDAALAGALLSRNLRAQIARGLRQHPLDEVIQRLQAP